MTRCGMRLLPLSTLFIAACAFAQYRGTITGTVTDSSGAVVTGTKTSLINPATGLSQNTVTGNDGLYSFSSLPAGKYDLTFEKEGFQKVESARIEVRVNTATRLDVKLAVGTVAQTVDIKAVAPLLQADRSDLGNVIQTQSIQDLPLFANGGLRSNLAFAWNFH